MKPAKTKCLSVSAVTAGMLAAALSMLVQPALSGVTLISPVGASGTASGGQTVQFTIDDSGMVDSATNPVVAATNALADTSVEHLWESLLTNSGAKYDLWGTTQLSGMYIWNGNRSLDFDLRSRGVSNANVYVSNTGVGTPVTNPAEWTKITSTPITVNQSPTAGANVAGQQIALSSSMAARYVYLQPLTTYGADGYVNVSEVRFQGSGGTLVPIANPSFQRASMSIVGPGGNLSGWAVSGNAGAQAIEGDTYNAAKSHLGRYGWLRTISAGQTIALSQNLGTVQGHARYELQMMISQRQVTVVIPYHRIELIADSGSTLTDIIDSGQQVTTGTLLGAWQTLSLQGSAAGELNGQALILKISAINRTGANPEDVALDDIRLLMIVVRPSGTVISLQ